MSIHISYACDSKFSSCLCQSVICLKSPSSNIHSFCLFHYPYYHCCSYISSSLPRTATDDKAIVAVSIKFINFVFIFFSLFIINIFTILQYGFILLKCKNLYLYYTPICFKMQYINNTICVLTFEWKCTV